MFNAIIRRDPDAGSVYQSGNVKLPMEKNETGNRVIITERMVVKWKRGGGGREVAFGWRMTLHFTLMMMKSLERNLKKGC